MTKNGDLLDIRNYLYDQAELRWWWSLIISLFAQFFSLLVTIINVNTFVYISGFLIAISPISVIILRAWADDFTQKADKCRRLILYSDSLKSPIPNYELLTIRSWTTGIELQSAPFVTPYYYSRMNEGSKRLADNTAESAFYTQFLANKAFNCLLIIILISILLILSTIYFGAFESKPVFLVSIISILLSSDIIAIAKKYWDLRMSAKEAFKNCSNLIEQDSLSLENAMQTVEDYHLTLIQSPPIPLKLYLKYRNKVNELYQQSKVSNQRQEK